MNVRIIITKICNYIRLFKLEILLFCENNLKNIKSPSAKAKGLKNVRLPLLETFRTFKGNIAIENIRLNQLILQY